jgi:MFS family permease
MTVLRSGAIDERIARHSRALVFVLAANMLIDAIEVSAMLVAAPAVGRELGLGVIGTQWLISAFALGFGGVVLFGGRLVDRFGSRRVFLTALVVFALASAVAGFAGDPAVLIATRVVKGVCAALTAPTGLAIIVAAFPAGQQRDRAVSAYTLAGAGGFSLGLVLTGVLTEASWRWALAFPAPVVLALLLFAAPLLPAADADRHGFDLVGPLRRAVADRGLVRAAAGAATLNGSYTGLLFLVTTQLQTQLGWGALRTALAILPASVPLAVTARYSAPMVRRFGAARLIALGAVPPALGYLLYLRPDSPRSYVLDLLPTLVLVAAGFVLSFTALNTRAVADVSAADRSAVVGAYQAAVQAGAVLVPAAVALALVAGHGSPRWAVLVIATVGVLGVLIGVAGAAPVSARGPKTSEIISPPTK